MYEEDYYSSIAIHFCGMEKCENGHSFGPAVRNQYLLHYILSGKGIYQVGSEKFNLKAGDFFLIKPSELTIYKADDLEPWTYMWVAFDGYEAKKMLKDCEINYVSKVNNYTDFIGKFKELIQIYNSDKYNEYQGLSIFYGMIAELAGVKKISLVNTRENYFKKAVSYMMKNFINPINITEIADYVGVERTYLYKIFIEYSGVSPKKYLIDIRIKAAIKLLLLNEFTQSQIANSTGFRDAQSFSKHFKSITGVTPNKYKKQTFRYGEHGGEVLEINK